MFPSILKERLWHTTSVPRFESIQKMGSIRPNPPIPDSERWYTRKGSGWYPYVRELGGVSLFDFKDFDPEDYQKRCPSSSVYTFVPYNEKWKESIWIEIDREKVQDRFIDGHTLLKRNKEENALRNNIMPYIEAAYIGEISIDCFARVLISNEANGFLEYES